MNTWDYQAFADSDGQVTLSYKYTGFHALYRVFVSLDAYVTHEGDTTFTTLHIGQPMPPMDTEAQIEEVLEEACRRLVRDMSLAEWLAYFDCGEDLGLEPQMVVTACQP